MIMKTSRQIAKLNEKTCKQILDIIKSHKLLNEYNIIKTNELTEKQIDKIIKNSCDKFGTNILFIKKLINLN